MDWKQLLSESENVKVVESGMLGAVEWKHYANGLLTFFGKGTISNFLYELTYPGYHDEDHTECHPYWRSWIGKGIDTPVKYVYISEGITEIEEGAFEACYIEEVFIPNSVTKIGAKVFSDNNLETINLPNTLESVGYRCFEKSRKLKSLFIPASVKELGSIGGKYVSAIEEIIVDENNTNYTVLDGILYTADMTQLLWCPASASGTLLIPSSVNRVDADAFDNCSLLKEVVFTDNPIVLGTRCFNNTALHKLVLPRKVEIEYFGIFGCGYHNHPVTWQSVPCETDNLVVYIEKDCTAWDYFKSQNIRIYGEPVDYNYAVRLTDNEQQNKNSSKSRRKKSFFHRLFTKK